MDRCAVFVDAGYLYAEGGKLCCGTPSRTQSVLQPDLAELSTDLTHSRRLDQL